MARIEQSIEVNVPVQTVYDQLVQFEQYPRFMEDVEQVRQLDDTHLHCKTRAGSLNLEWDAEITQQVPERSIAWRNTSEPHYEGRLDLQPAAPDKTRITLTIEHAPGQQLLAQHGDAENALARRSEYSLGRFKKFIEHIGQKTTVAHGGTGEAQTAAPQGAQQGSREGSAAPQGAQQGPREGGAAPQGAQQGPREGGAARKGAQQAGQDRQPWFLNLLQVWDEPLNIMRRMTEEMDQLVETFVGRPGVGGNRAGAPATEWTPAVEIFRREDKFVVNAELPGVRRDDVQVEIKNDRVIIEGNRRPQTDRQSQELHRSERSYGHFYRVIALPEGAVPDAASAALHDGMLEITVPVPDGGRRGRRIDIRTQ